MASAGALPPNTKNGAGFIHDPKLAHLPEVKAQIRMLFRTLKGREICAIRSFQLTNKKTGGKTRQQFRALESVLRTENDQGDKASISHRCVDMDKEVPDLMGVSRAVLESVIFCHQEDSNWPLAEMGALKKRFDDIFGATRYTKALKDIKRLQKDWGKEKVEKKHNADLMQTHLDQAQRLQAKVQEQQQRDAAIVADLQTIDGDIASAESEAQHAERALSQLEGLGLKIAELQGGKTRVESQCRQVEQGILQRGQELYQESLDDLQGQVKQFEEVHLVQSTERLRQERAALEESEQAYHKALAASRKLREDLGEAAAAADFLHSRQAEFRERLDKSGQPSIAALRDMLQRKSEEFERLEKEQRSRDAALEESISAAERELQRSSLEASKNEQRVADATTTVRRLEEEMRTLSRAESELDIVMRSIQATEAHLNADGNEKRLRDMEEQQGKIGRRKNDLQYQITQKSNAVAQLELQSGTLAEVDVLRNRLREAEAELCAKSEKLRPQLTALLGSAPEAAEAEGKFQAEMRATQEKLQKHRAALDSARRKQSSACGRRGAAENEVRRLQSEKDALESRLSGAGTNLLERISEQQNILEACRKDFAMTESAQHMYEKFREKSRSKHACQFCRRSFTTSEELCAFEDSVQKLIDKIPAFFDASKGKLDSAHADLRSMEELRPHWDRLQHLRNHDIPTKQREIAEAFDEERQAQTATNPEEREIQRLEQHMQRLQDLRAEVAALQRLQVSVNEQRQSVQSREARLLGNNSKVSLQAERDQLRALHDELNKLGTEEDSIRSQRDMIMKQCTQQRSQLADQKGKLQTLQAQVARSKDVEAELNMTRSNLQGFSEQARRALDAQRTADANLKKFRDERTQLNAKYRKDIESRDGEVRMLQREADALNELEKDVKLLRAKASDAESVKARLAESDRVSNEREAEVSTRRKGVDEAAKKQREIENIREELEANVKLKTLEKEVQQIQGDIEAHQRELGGHDLDKLRKLLEEKRECCMHLQKRRSYREGELTQARSAINALQEDLRSTLYVDIEQRHRQALIEHETAAMTAADLGKYYTALDKALMKYHSMKMEEINKRIKALWQRVYRGHDIDYVVLRSDTEEAPSDEDGVRVKPDGGGLLGSVSYNYRVVMICGDAELDMRGRCSAGQKVLASLIIRLALAESFCINCGVLALDEPTTNLDAANVRGLAEALAELIEMRRGHANFQLMLITHDEAFVEQLARLQVCDWYYQLRKNEEGNSTIERKEIRLLGG